MLKNIILALVCMTMIGCTKDVVYQNNPTLNHPTMPAPIQERTVKVKVIKVNGEVYVAKTYEDDIEFNIWLEDVIRYATDLKSLLCFYRKDLNEPDCKIEEKKEP